MTNGRFCPGSARFSTFTRPNRTLLQAPEEEEKRSQVPSPYSGRTRDGFAPLLLRFSYAPIEAELERSKSGANTPQIRGW